MVNEEDAIEIIHYAEIYDISMSLNGGWGVDAPLEKQTREHNDFSEMKNP